MNCLKELYDPNFVPDGWLEPGDPVPSPFGRNTTVTDYFVVKYVGEIMTLYGYGDVVAIDYGEIHNIRVIGGGNVIAKGCHIILQDI